MAKVILVVELQLEAYNCKVDPRVEWLEADVDSGDWRRGSDSGSQHQAFGLNWTGSAGLTAISPGNQFRFLRILSRARCRLLQ